uniref:Serine/threonine-protein kinase SSN3 n=1 Tax=Talaromyces marneffei PM1 TaxID=1077442 RepID=A0A093W0Z0_TALMA
MTQASLISTIHHEIYTSIGTSVTDPWELYEPRARVNGGFEVILARHRITKSRLVAIQPLRDIDSTTAVTQIRRNSHRSFPELLDHMADSPQQYLVWEPWEASLADMLASNCDVTDHEIVEIIWPVLSGIAFLRKQGLALVSLTESHVLLMAQGSVKIGCQLRLHERTRRTRGVGQGSQHDRISHCGIPLTRETVPIPWSQLVR